LVVIASSSWKAKSEEVEDEIYGPVWIADANEPNVRLEKPAEWVTWEQAEELPVRAPANTTRASCSEPRTVA
jgi:hypothetical protein